MSRSAGDIELNLGPSNTISKVTKYVTNVQSKNYRAPICGKCKKAIRITPKRYFLSNVKTPFISNAALRKTTLNTELSTHAL